MDKKQIKAFLELNEIKPFSAAYIIYMFTAKQGSKEKLNEILAKREDTEDDLKNREIIKNLHEPKDFFKWMRKPLAGENKFLLRKAMLQEEDHIMEMVQTKLLTNRTDEFIECTTDFFIQSKQDNSDWIRNHYQQILSPYAQSLMCLVLGFRGEETDNTFLLKEYERLQREYSEENYDQGPLIALYILNDMQDRL